MRASCATRGIAIGARCAQRAAGRGWLRKALGSARAWLPTPMLTGDQAALPMNIYPVKPRFTLHGVGGRPMGSSLRLAEEGPFCFGL